MILGTITTVPASKTKLHRPYVAGIVVGWYTHSIIQWGRYTILREVPFGGYRMHIKFTTDFWDWNSSTWDRFNAIEDMYATAPGSSTPISFGSMHWVYKYAGNPVKGIILNLQLQPNDNHYTYYPTPRNTDPFWIENPHTSLSPIQFIP